MGYNLVEKILKKHLVEGDLDEGDEIAIRVDQTLTQDATGTMTYLQFETMGIPRVKTELSVSYIDHNTLQVGFENADDHKYLQTAAAKYGIALSKAGNGICHQVHLERFGVPGKTLLGSDSHTPTGGGIGMIAIGVGGLDVAVAMGGGAFYMPRPKVVKVNLTGALQPFVSAKDVILKLLSILTTKGNVGRIVEYGGPALADLSVPERATMTNMGAELGVTTSIFPSDEQTRAFLKAQMREGDYTPLAADDDAEYERVINIDLSGLAPLLARPHSPDNVTTVESLAGKKINQVCIGSCTNSSLRDLTVVGRILKGRKINTNVELIIAPGSRQVEMEAAERGLLTTFLEAGARLAETACGFCIGAGHAPGSGEVSVRSNNRNFKGRSGTADAMIYLASPETCVACALAGEITDPRSLGIDPIAFELPERFTIDDSMVLEPPEDATNVQVVRGPNIGAPPRTEPLPDTIEKSVLLKVGDKITTDHIMPAGQYLKYRSNIPKYAEVVFIGVDPTFAARAKDKGGGFIVGGDSYGQGSSREHAAICPSYLGVKAVFAKTIERIHKTNLVNFGILPLVFIKGTDYDAVDQGDSLRVEGIYAALDGDRTVGVLNLTKGTSFRMKIDVSTRQAGILKDGGTLSHIAKGAK